MEKVLFENEGYIISIDNGLHIVRYKAGVNITEQIARHAITQLIKIVDNTTVPILLDASSFFTMDKAAFTYVAINGAKIIRAQAVVVTDKIQEGTSILFEIFEKPPTLTKTFIMKMMLNPGFSNSWTMIIQGQRKNLNNIPINFVLRLLRP